MVRWFWQVVRDWANSEDFQSDGIFGDFIDLKFATGKTMGKTWEMAINMGKSRVFK